MTRTLLEIDFSKYRYGPFTQAMAKDAFSPTKAWPGNPPDSWWAERNVTIADSKNRPVLSIRLKAGTIGGGSGPVVFIPLTDAVSDITFEMEHQFAPGFELDMGGKLPGVGITSDPTLSPPTGGAAPTTGASLRHMWRTRGEAGAVRPPGSAACYTYHPNSNRSDVWGEYEFIEKPYPVGSYSVTTTRAKVNKPGVQDGILQSRVGVLPWTLNLSNYEWVPAGADPNKWLWNRFCLAVFRGGNTTEWSSATDGLVQFRRFKITTPV